MADFALMAEPSMSIVVRPGNKPRTVLDAQGRLLAVPAEWELLAPGDPGLTRRVKADGPHWVVEVQKGRRRFSQGVWAPAATIAQQRTELQRERQTVEYQDRRLAQQQRRERDQRLYVAQFRAVVIEVLRFAPCHRDTAERLADAVVAQATPVGSGTVARTQRLGLAAKAELALMAWLRHHTSDYDRMHVARIKGERREVRRRVAVQSRQLLESYRRGGSVDHAACPLQRALAVTRTISPPDVHQTPAPADRRGAWEGAFDGFMAE